MLSQNVFHNKNNVGQINRPPFNQADYHLEVNEQALIGLGLYHVLACTVRIELLFLQFPFGGLIIGDASLFGALFTMGLAASKRTVNIVALCIAGSGQK